MAVVTSSIGTASRDYSTLSAWEADLDDTGTYSSGDDAVGEVYNDSAFDESLTINGGATVGLNSVLFTVPESERHDGTAGTGARMTASVAERKLRLSPVSGGPTVTVEWFEWDGGGKDVWYPCSGTNIAIQKTVRNCLLHSFGNWTTCAVISLVSVTHFDVLNCLIYDVNCQRTSSTRWAYGINSQGGTGDVQNLMNLTVHNVRGTNAGGDAIGIQVTTTGRTLRNAVVTDTSSTNFSTEDFVVTAGSRDYCASSDTTAPGANSLTEIASADQYVSTAVGAEDLHLKSGADCLGAGEGQGTTPSNVEVDIDGRDRDAESDTWDIGADQFVSSALNYTGTSLGLFRQLGRLVKHYNLQGDDAADAVVGLAAARNEILAAFGAGDLEYVSDGLSDAFAGWELDYVDRRSELIAFMIARLRDKESVLDPICAESSSLSEVLYRLIDQMETDSETINASSVSLGSVTAGGSNVGNGTVLTTKVLDGHSSPGSREGISYPAHPAYKGLDSELAVPSETMTLVCQSDSYGADGVTTFSWAGKLPDPGGQHGVDDEGSGTIATINEIHEETATYLSNADFETFTVANTPDDWTIDAGTVGTHIKESTNEVAHGTSSLNFLGDDSQANIQVSQAIDASLIDTNRRYLVSAMVKADDTIAAGTLTIQFEGTGYTPGSGEKIEIAPGSLPTSWTLQHFFLNMPSSIPEDFALVVKWTGTPTLAKNVYIDDIGLAPVNYGGGVGVAVVRGATPFVKRDRFTFTVSNTEGVFQRAFRRIFGVQLPSDDSATETIADSLAS